MSETNENPRRETPAIRRQPRPSPKPLPEPVVRFLRQRSQKRHQRGMKTSPIVKILAMVGGLLLVIAVATDMARQSRQIGNLPRIPSDDHPGAMVLGYRDRVFQDPLNRFRIRVPEPWAVYTGEAAHPYQVRFYGPREMEIAVFVSPFDGSIDQLKERIEAQARDWAIPANIQIIETGARPVVERTYRLVKKAVRARDFLTPGLAHHIQAAVPRDRFDDLLPLLVEILDTYEPGPFEP